MTANRSRIAVIGSGAGGLVAAWKLGATADVDVFEASGRAGGHIHAVAVPLPDGTVAHLDTGFIAWSPKTYPQAAAVFDELGLASRVADYPVWVWDRPKGSLVRLSDFPARCGRDLSPEAGRDLRRLVALLMRAGAALEPVDDDTTLGEFLEKRGYHADLLEHLVLPAMVVVWGYQVDDVLAMSTGAALGLMRRTMFVDTGAEFRQLWPSSEPYRNALLARLGRPVRTSCPVSRVSVDSSGVGVTHAGGTERYDRVLLATPPNQALSLLEAPTPLQAELLGALDTHVTYAVVHCDASWLPVPDHSQRAFVTTWMAPRADGRRRCSTTWNMGSFHGLSTDKPLLVTIGDEGIAAEIDAASTFAVVRNHHISLKPPYRRARRALDSLEVPGRLYFSGSWLGPVGSHECAVVSSLAAAERIRTMEAR
jgi:predicted NAD/FAD-binding protein